MALKTWAIDTRHSEVRFSLRHLVLARIEGRAELLDGEIRYDRDDPTRSSVTATIGAATLKTGDVERDGHIASPEFLDVARFPEMRFESREIRPSASGGFDLLGKLTIRDLTRDVRLHMIDQGAYVRPDGVPSEQVGPYAATGTINRQEFGLHWNQDLDTGGIVLGDKVEVTLRVEVQARDEARPTLSQA